MTNNLRYLFSIKFILITLITVAAILQMLCKYGPYFDKYFFKPSAKQYGKIALNKIDKHALYAKGKQWKILKEDISGRFNSCKSYEDTLPHIKEALIFAGGKHSFILLNEPLSTIEDNNKSILSLPTINCENHNLYISVPPFSGDADDSKIYKDIIENALLNEDYQNVIIDLRKNTGGDMGPMITGLSPLLKDGYLMSFVMKDNSEHKVYIKNGEVIGAGTHVRVKNRQYIKVDNIAVLISSQTASSGEITALSFDGLNNCQFFGEASAGYTTSNNSIELYDGVILNITSSKLKTRTGTLYDNNPIIPDIKTDSPYIEAIEWLYK